MKKFFTSLLSAFLFLLISTLFSPQVHAQVSCDITKDPKPLTSAHKWIKLIIKGGLAEGEKYWVKVDNNYVSIPPSAVTSGKPDELTADSSRAITTPLFNETGRTFTPLLTTAPFLTSKTFFVTVTEPKKDGFVFCTGTFGVVEVPSGGACRITFLKPHPTSNDGVAINAFDLPGDGTQKWLIKLLRRGETSPIKTACNSKSELEGGGVDLGKREPGNYVVKIGTTTACIDVLSTDLCLASVRVRDPDEPEPVNPEAEQDTTAPLGKNRCKLVSDKPISYECDTAIGSIPTNLTEFIKKIFSVLLSLAGGVALLLIMVSGYKLMTSSGDPEKVKGAQETLTSAIVGLLFILFSLVILEIIGVDLLRIPGFGT